MYRFFNVCVAPNLRNDSIIRAIAIAKEMDYGYIFRAINKHKKITGAHYFCSPGHPQDFLSNVLHLNRVSISPNKNGYRMSAADFCKEHPHGRYIIALGNEWSAVIDGVILDIRDCSNDQVYAYYVC